MKLAKFFYCMRSIRISVLCTEDLQCVMVMVMKISVHTPVSLLLSARHPSWQPTTLTGQSCCFSCLQWCVAFTWHILSLGCRGPLGRLESLLRIQLLCCSFQKCFWSMCTPNASSSSPSLCIWILSSVKDYSFHSSASPLKRIQEG